METRTVPTSNWMRRMFDSVPKTYVLSNKVLTFGMDEIWRRRTKEAIGPREGDKILDMCTGPADLAIKIAGSISSSKVYACDFSSNMLEEAKSRTRRVGVKNIYFIETDCANMGLRSDSFDCVTISFGFRNLSYSHENLTKSLREVHRVLKNGGRFIIVETSQPANILLKKLFHFYTVKVVPKIGTFLSGAKEPYAYLGNSIVKFYSREELISLLAFENFKCEKTTPFLSGTILLSVFKKYGQ